jgi:hypothetical protein
VVATPEGLGTTEEEDGCAGGCGNAEPPPVWTASRAEQTINGMGGNVGVNDAPCPPLTGHGASIMLQKQPQSRSQTCLKPQ